MYDAYFRRVSTHGQTGISVLLNNQPPRTIITQKNYMYFGFNVLTLTIRP